MWKNDQFLQIKIRSQPFRITEPKQETVSNNTENKKQININESIFFRIFIKHINGEAINIKNSIT